MLFCFSAEMSLCEIKFAGVISTDTEWGNNRRSSPVGFLKFKVRILKRCKNLLKYENSNTQTAPLVLVLHVSTRKVDTSIMCF